MNLEGMGALLMRSYVRHGGGNVVTLDTLELENYRCFKRHRLAFHNSTVIVGANNAGKSTVVEALRLLSLVSERYATANYVVAPAELGIGSVKGITPSLEGIDFIEASLCYQYSKPPAIITARFSNGAVVMIYVMEDRYAFATVTHPVGGLIENKGAARRVEIPRIRVLDNIGPMAADERVLTDRHLRKSAATRLAPTHFRNHLAQADSDEYARFRQVAAEWRGLDVRPVQTERTSEGVLLSVDVKEDGFTAEASWMGLGVQAWLQIAWHIATAGRQEVMVLDEPDVYMHADMQRRVAKLIRGRFAQTIVATHSVELVAESQPHDVLVVDKRAEESAYAGSAPEIQSLVDRIGTRYNLQVARLVQAKKCLLVEGGDLRVLASLFDTGYPRSKYPLDVLPSWPIGGWGGWESAVQWGEAFRKHQTDTRVYCLLDRDHHTEAEIAGRLEQAAKAGVDLHIWKRKELESYLLVPDVVSRALAKRLRVSAQQPPSPKEVHEALVKLSESMKDDTFDRIAEGYGRRNPRFGAARVNAYARESVDANWDTLEKRLSIVHGKNLLRVLLDWCATNYGAIGEGDLLSAFTVSDIPSEMVSVLAAIENSRPFRRS